MSLDKNPVTHYRTDTILLGKRITEIITSSGVFKNGQITKKKQTNTTHFVITDCREPRSFKAETFSHMLKTCSKVDFRKLF